VRAKVQRGRIVYLRKDGHARVIPTDRQEKLGRRPFLVVQNDYANAAADRTLVVALTSYASVDKIADLVKLKIRGTDVYMPKGKQGEGLANYESVADCGSVFTVYENEIHNVFDGTYHEDVMKYVDAALRTAMELDTARFYSREIKTA